jgi:long-chain acyl-CoA synthetase
MCRTGRQCPDYIISYFAILRAGGIAIPLNTFLTSEEISYILRDSGCNMLIYGPGFQTLAEEVKKQVPGIRAVPFDEIPQEASEQYRGNDDDVAVLLYTSGTTGFPKGAMLTNRNLISNVEATIKVINFTSSDRLLLFLPLFSLSLLSPFQR